MGRGDREREKGERREKRGGKRRRGKQHDTYVGKVHKTKIPSVQVARTKRCVYLPPGDVTLTYVLTYHHIILHRARRLKY